MNVTLPPAARAAITQALELVTLAISEVQGENRVSPDFEDGPSAAAATHAADAATLLGSTKWDGTPENVMRSANHAVTMLQTGANAIRDADSWETPIRPELVLDRAELAFGDAYNDLSAAFYAR